MNAIPLALKGGWRQPRLLAVDGERAIEARKGRSDLGADRGLRRASQHIAAVRTFVSQDTVVEQRPGAPVVDAEQRGTGASLPRAVPRPAGFREPDMSSEDRKPDIRPDAPVRDERRRAEPVEAEAAAARPADALGNTALLAVDHFVQPRRAMADGMVAHLDADISPSHFVRDGGRRAGTEERVEHEIVRVSRNLQYTRKQSFWFQCDKWRAGKQS